MPRLDQFATQGANEWREPTAQTAPPLPPLPPRNAPTPTGNAREPYMRQYQQIESMLSAGEARFGDDKRNKTLERRLKLLENFIKPTDAEQNAIARGLTPGTPEYRRYIESATDSRPNELRLFDAEQNNEGFRQQRELARRSPEYRKLIDAGFREGSPEIQAAMQAVISNEPEAIRTARAVIKDPTLMKTVIELKKAGATSINTAEGLEAAQLKARMGVDTDIAKEIGQQALAGMRLLPALDEVERLARETPGGFAGQLSASLSRGLSGFGIDVPKGWTNAEALQSISQRLVPIVREPGPTSEKELAIYLRAVPGLMQSEAGRLKVVAITRNLVLRANQIARVYRDNIGAPDLYDKLAALDKPMFAEEDLKEMEKLGSGEQSSTPRPTRPAPSTLPPGWSVERENR
jgi:hypothetical protein